MNGLDYLILIVIAMGAMRGLSQGALRMITSIISLVGGLYIASIYYGQAAAIAEHYLGPEPTANSVVGFLAVFALAFIVIEMVGASVTRAIHMVSLGWVDRVAGAALGAGISAAVMGLLVMMMTAVMPGDAGVLRDSQLAPRLMVYNQALVNYIPENVKVAYFEKRALLVRYWMESEARLAQQAASPHSSPSAAK